MREQSRELIAHLFARLPYAGPQLIIEHETKAVTLVFSGVAGV